MNFAIYNFTTTRVIFTSGLIVQLSDSFSALQICWYFCSVLNECIAKCWVCCFYLLLFLSLTCPPGSRICPFFSQVSWGSGSPWAWQVKMAVVPTGRAMDCGGWTNSAGAERGGETWYVRFAEIGACWLFRSPSFINDELWYTYYSKPIIYWQK